MPREIDSLLEKVGALKGEIGKYNKYIQGKINDRKKDINEFLSIAGFKYTFDIDVNGENNARALLKFILPDGNPGDVQSPGKHLSWGEKHAFALILFMFDAISKNAELIILDDPISSFYSNKKYAIINRLFKTGDKANSLYQRTVLMLTHDFEPVIDYLQVGSGRHERTSRKTQTRHQDEPIVPRGVRGSAISGLSESLDIIGFERVIVFL